MDFRIVGTFKRFATGASCAGLAGLLLLALVAGVQDTRAAEGEAPDVVPWSGDLCVITLVPTRVSPSGGVASVDLVPPQTVASPGDAVLWLNAVPGAAMHVVMDAPPPTVQQGRTLPPLATPYVSPRLGPGDGGVLSFPTAGVFPYRVVIATPEVEVAVRGVVVIRE